MDHKSRDLWDTFSRQFRDNLDCSASNRRNLRHHHGHSSPQGSGSSNSAPPLRLGFPNSTAELSCSVITALLLSSGAREQAGPRPGGVTLGQWLGVGSWSTHAILKRSCLPLPLCSDGVSSRGRPVSGERSPGA